jgi:hypothetical protein
MSWPRISLGARWSLRYVLFSTQSVTLCLLVGAILACAILLLKILRVSSDGPSLAADVASTIEKGKMDQDFVWLAQHAEPYPQSKPVTLPPTIIPLPGAQAFDDPNQLPIRRTSYTKQFDDIGVEGEIVVAEGWRRHTRVYGGGVCQACEESERRMSAVKLQAG